MTAGIELESSVTVPVTTLIRRRNPSIRLYRVENTVELVYLDYGNNEERPVSELRPLDPAFARLPAQAICAALEVSLRS